MEKIRKRRFLAFLMAAFMTATVLFTATPAQVQANPLTAPTIWLSGDVLHWSASIPGDPNDAWIEFYANGVLFLSRSGFSAASGFQNLRDTSLVNQLGTYTIQATLHYAPLGVNSPFSNAVTWTNTNQNIGQLPTPNISISAQGILSWSPGGAQHVSLYRDGSWVWDSASAVSQVNLTQIWFPLGHSSIQIRFVDPNNPARDSFPSNSVPIYMTNAGWGGVNHLAAPSLWVSSNGVLSWNAIPGATTYAVWMVGRNAHLVQLDGNHNTSFDLRTISHNIPAGSQQFFVAAGAWGVHGQAVWSANSNTVTFNMHGGHTLPAPTGVFISGNSVHWNVVTNASAYRVYVGNTARSNNISGTSFNLDSLNLAAGNHTIRIRAIGNGTTTLNSALSTGVNFNVPRAGGGAGGATPSPSPTPTPALAPAQAPANVRLEGSILRWDPVPDARSYVVYVAGAARSSPTVATQFPLGTLSLPFGSHNIQVRSIGNGETTLDSALSASVTWTRVEPQTPQHQGDEASPWARSWVQYAIDMGIVPQLLQTQYTRPITRAEFAALAVGLYETVMRYEITPNIMFNDTNDLNVRKMGTLGVVQGVGNGNFAPNNTLTREQAAVMLARLAEAMGQPLPQHAPTFADSGSISPWAIDAVGQVQAAGVMQGVYNSVFSPAGVYTREQSIVTILRLYDTLN